MRKLLRLTLLQQLGYVLPVFSPFRWNVGALEVAGVVLQRHQIQGIVPEAEEALQEVLMPISAARVASCCVSDSSSAKPGGSAQPLAPVLSIARAVQSTRPVSTKPPVATNQRQAFCTAGVGWLASQAGRGQPAQLPLATA